MSEEAIDEGLRLEAAFQEARERRITSVDGPAGIGEWTTSVGEDAAADSEPSVSGVAPVADGAPRSELVIRAAVKDEVTAAFNELGVHTHLTSIAAAVA